VLIASGEFDHGFTYSGHPVSCAVAIENIRILKQEKLVERVGHETGPYLEARLKELLDHPLVGEVRLKGFMGAIELVKDKKTRTTYQPLGEVGTLCRDHCFAIGLVMRATRDTMLISPPLSWTKVEIDEFIALTRKALDLTLADVKKRFA
jgi:putrescine aminotransferase